MADERPFIAPIAAIVNLLLDTAAVLEMTKSMHFYDSRLVRRPLDIAGRGLVAMLHSPTCLAGRSGSEPAACRRSIVRTGLIGLIHLVALGLMVWSEPDPVAKLVFVSTWGLFNFLWLVVCRRALVAALLSLALVVALVLLSRLKHEIIWTTASFLDVWIVNADTVDYLLQIKPTLLGEILLALVLVSLALGAAWRIDRAGFRRSRALAGLATCLAGAVGVAAAYPAEEWEGFSGTAYVSHFVRSGVAALSTLATQGYMEADAGAAERLPAPGAACRPAAKAPHIVLVHDESSFDARALPGVTVPPGYGGHFRSFDGQQRRLIMETAGGASWSAEYNVLAGLSARSFGRFAYYVTQIAAGRVERGLPAALRRCGYQTASIYPALGAFMSARAFQASLGVQSFADRTALGTGRIEPDRFYFDAARAAIARRHVDGPVFVLVYLGQNHWPWSDRWRPDLLPEWKDLGNAPNVDEYLRRQAMTARDYRAFVDDLRRDFPGEQFLIVRYGDHQPDFASWMIEPGLDEAAIGRRLMTYDPRYYTTYYAIDAINFTPRVASAPDPIEAPYLPLVVQEAAGLPLDPSFAEQKRIMARCRGLFYACADGAEARRFNRLLIDAGLIKGL